MSEIPMRRSPVEDDVDEHGDRQYRRTMTPEEILERERLNAANTTERLRARVLAAGNGGPAAPFTSGRRI